MKDKNKVIDLINKLIRKVDKLEKRMGYITIGWENYIAKDKQSTQNSPEVKR